MASFRKWFRTRHAQELTLGDLRHLLEKMYELTLPVPDYIVKAIFVSRGFPYYVYRVYAEPRPGSAE
ncbi:hypothetical protein D5S17_14665 [Pseudonocardiaceae bacterium YIM PH 21723]|nr:hypothetical protein D5S17_14665 [Pseudonocardiaceae bacterium YIM PH 21723]